MPVDAGCPVTADTLMAALRTSGSDIYQRAARPAALKDVSCYQQFAIAETVPSGQTDSTRIVFHYDGAARSWRPVNLGSAGACTGYVPTDIAAKLAGCGS